MKWKTGGTRPGYRLVAKVVGFDRGFLQSTATGINKSQIFFFYWNIALKIQDPGEEVLLALLGSGLHYWSRSKTS